MRLLFKVLLFNYLVLVLCDLHSPCPDAKVTDLAAVSVSPTSMRLSWTPPPLYVGGRRCYDKVWFRHGSHSRNEERLRCAAWSANEYGVQIGVSLLGLEPCTAYDVSVSVRYEGGREAAERADTTVHTLPAAAENLTVTSVTDTSLAVAWTTKCKAWKAFLRLSGADHTPDTVGVDEVRVVPATPRPVEFTGLTPCTLYNVDLALLPRSQELAAGNYSAPTNTTNVAVRTKRRVGSLGVTSLTATGFTVSWDPIAVRLVRDNAKYQVALRTSSRGTLHKETWYQNETFKVFENMEPCTEFDVSVKFLPAVEVECSKKELRKVKVHTFPISSTGTIAKLGTDWRTVAELCLAQADRSTTLDLAVITLSVCVLVLAAMMVVLKWPGVRIRGHRWKIVGTRDPPVEYLAKSAYTREPFYDSIQYQEPMVYNEVYDKFYPDGVYTDPQRF